MLTRSRQQILIVEDDDNTREMMSFLLKPLGASLVPVQTAHQALQLVKSRRFDLYIVDCWLPQIDGFALCKRIRDVDPLGRILFYSGAATRADIARAKFAGADAYVIKPDIEGLISRVEALLQKAGLPSCVPSNTSNNPRMAAAIS
jgi:two-component system OmpR family response regulator